MTGRSRDVPATIRSRRSRLLVGIALALPTFLLAGVLWPGAVTAGEGGLVEESRGPAVVPPGETITTHDEGGPLNAADPFEVALKNVGNADLLVTIAEERCTRPENADLCSGPRVGGIVGNFTFPFVPPPPPPDLLRGSSTGSPIVVAKLFYDRSLLVGVRGFRIFWQKTETSPVLRLPPCDRFDHDDDHRTVRKTECFSRKKLANGDEVVRIPLKDDPKFTRG